MQLEILDYCALIGYLLVVVVLALGVAWRWRWSEDCFLAGRRLTWCLIGLSLIAWRFIAPGVVAVFLFGLLSKRTPSRAATGALLLGPPAYMCCLMAMPDNVAPLHLMTFAFIFVCVYLCLVTLLTPLRQADASTEGDEAVRPQRPAGLLANTLIPFGTAILGAYLLGQSLFHFSFFIIYQYLDHWGLETFPDWVHFVNAGVPTALYFALALWLMRRPAPAARLVQPTEDARPTRSRFRVFLTRTAAALAALFVGLHVYLFCYWVIRDRPAEEYWQGYYVDLSAIGTIRPVITEKPLVEEETEPVLEPQPDEAGEGEPPEPAPPVPPPPPEPEPLTIYATPLLIGLGSVLAFFVLLECLRATAVASRPSRSRPPSST